MVATRQLRGGRLPFTRQLLLLQVLILLVVTGLGFTAAAWQLNHTLRQRFTDRALFVARTFATQPGLAADVRDRHQAAVQTRAQQARRATGALFVVVTDAAGIRLAHPNPAQIGRPVSTSPDAALRGRQVTNIERGTLGLSARGKVPLRLADGTIVGEVSVGFDAREITRALHRLLRDSLLLLGIALLAGVFGNLLLTRLLKRRIYGLEPADLAELVREREAVLFGVSDGVVAVDVEGRVTMLNAEAARLLGDRVRPGERLADTALPLAARRVMTGGISAARASVAGEPTGRTDRRRSSPDETICGTTAPTVSGGEHPGPPRPGRSTARTPAGGTDRRRPWPGDTACGTAEQTVNGGECLDPPETGPTAGTMPAGDAPARTVVTLDDRPVVISRRDVHHDGHTLGSVVTLVDRTEMESLTTELEGVRLMTQALRAQRHEFANRMHTVRGLLHTAGPDDALEYLDALDEGPNPAAGVDEETIAPASVRAFLAGKSAEAAEAGVTLALSETSWVPRKLKAPVEVITVLGNLVNNGVEAARRARPHPARVEVDLLTDGDALLISVADTGDGVPEELRENIFHEGFSTRGAGRGLGLHHARRTAAGFGGTVELRHPGGPTVFVARLPGVLREPGETS